MRKRLRDRNTDDQVEQLRFTVMVVLAGSFLLLVVEGILWPNARWLPLILMNIVLLTALSRVIWPIIDRGSHVLINTLAGGSGGDPRAFGYSEVESLVSRGQFAEAADMYRAIAEDRPGDADVWIRLGDVLGSFLKETAGAVAAYRAARRATPTAGQASRITNSLIDLHRAAGDTIALREELLRYAQLYPNAPAGRAAREEVRRLVREDHGPTHEGR